MSLMYMKLLLDIGHDKTPPGGNLIIKTRMSSIMDRILLQSIFDQPFEYNEKWKRQTWRGSLFTNKKVQIGDTL